MGSFLGEFRDFIKKGDVMDLAIALVLGLAFKAIISAAVDGLIAPIIALIVGKSDIRELTFTISDAVFLYGSVLQVTIDFVLTGLVLFLVVKALSNRRAEEPEDDTPAPPTETELLGEIRDLLANR